MAIYAIYHFPLCNILKLNSKPKSFFFLLFKETFFFPSESGENWFGFTGYLVFFSLSAWVHIYFLFLHSPV